MAALLSIDILGVWEAAIFQEPVDRALTLLTLLGENPAQIRTLPIGERDRRLWQLRQAIFGSDVEALTQCPACRERMEFQFSVEDVRAAPEERGQYEHAFRSGSWSILFRLPASADLAEIAKCERAIATEELANRCLIRVEKNGMEQGSTCLPDEILSAVGEEMSRLDPQADVSFKLSCAACGHQWKASFDIAQFLWSELSVLARRLLREVDLLARAYGWNELEILSLSPARRKAYLELVTS